VIDGAPQAADLAVSAIKAADFILIPGGNFQLSPERHAKLKIYAATQGKSIKEVLAEYVDTL
jgi:cellulose biosynthesis protein BcsQ